jgi:flagellar basal body L-ring protein FlgH
MELNNDLNKRKIDFDDEDIITIEIESKDKLDNENNNNFKTPTIPSITTETMEEIHNRVKEYRKNKKCRVKIKSNIKFKDTLLHQKERGYNYTIY